MVPMKDFENLVDFVFQRKQSKNSFLFQDSCTFRCKMMRSLRKLKTLRTFSKFIKLRKIVQKIPNRIFKKNSTGRSK